MNASNRDQKKNIDYTDTEYFVELKRVNWYEWGGEKLTNALLNAQLCLLQRVFAYA